MIKRTFDIISSVLGLIILSPVFIVVAWKVKNNLGTPVLFRQKRPGKDGKPFEMIKFRSMRDSKDENGNVLPDKDRRTPFGNKLRSTSLDELPELWNVLKGDMSIVGPRPLLMEYLPLYNEEQHRRHEVRPGITGWAQVNGRNAISWDDKFKLDVWYVDNKSLIVDIKIIIKTVKKVLFREDINTNSEITMPKFSGNKKETLAILGASGHGKVLADIAEQTGWDRVVFFDDAWPSVSNNGGWEVIGGSSELLDSLDSYSGVIVAIGNNEVRHSKLKQLIEVNANLVTLIHPSAVISKYSSIGVGSVVVANAVINSHTKIGFGAIINTSSSVGHDCVFGDAVHVCPGARIAGGVQIDDKSWVGVGSSIKQLVEIGSGTTIGAGAAVVSNIPSFVTAVGVPAKVIA